MRLTYMARATQYLTRTYTRALVKRDENAGCETDILH
jgi:hypothetical protein